MQKTVIGAALLLLLGGAAHAAEVRGVALSQGATGTRADIALDVPLTDYRVIPLAGPDRLVIDFPASQLRRGLVLPGPAGIVRAVRTGQPAPGVARIVFDLAQPVTALRPHLMQGASGVRLVIEWPGEFPAAVAAPAPAVESPRLPSPSATAVKPPPASPASTLATASAQGPLMPIARSPSPATTSAQPSTGASRIEPASPVAPEQAPAAAAKQPDRPASALQPGAPSATPVVPPPVAAVARPPALPATLPAPLRDQALQESKTATKPARPLRPLVIAIDAGHGGQDPGAIGPGGHREKVITLAIARELARQLNATPGYKAVLTRDGDVFLPLHQRTRIARQAKADMFVSIHADAAENRAARGSSVYVLSTKGASSQRARWLADKENAADLIGGVKVEPGNTLASVLLDLTQSGNLRASEDAAASVLEGLGRVGPHHKASVERANFAVLRTSDIPAMLVETAFLSNPAEEQRLVDPEQQRAIARAVLEGVDSFFRRQPPPGTLLAAAAAAAAR